MGNKYVGTGKLFFDGFSKVFKGPQSGGKVATIGGVKPKVGFSKATQKFKQNIKAIDQGLDKGIKDFKAENPKRQITDDQMTKVKSDKKKEMVGRETKAFLREKKRKGGRIGFKKGTGRTGVPAMDIKTKISLAKKKKKNQGGIDRNPNITAADPKAKFIAANKKNKKKVV
jgi:hypothetical protein